LQGGLDFASPAHTRAASVWALRGAIIAAVLALWEVVAESGWLFRDVVPTLPVIGRALARVLVDAGFYSNLAVTAAEIVASLAIGGIAGVAVGLLLGANRFVARAYEGFIYYLGPTP
jgi:ABC-type nitrate/sulfonate/bicarbonate transport system permease component